MAERLNFLLRPRTVRVMYRCFEAFSCCTRNPVVSDKANIPFVNLVRCSVCPSMNFFARILFLFIIGLVLYRGCLRSPSPVSRTQAIAKPTEYPS